MADKRLWELLAKQFDGHLTEEELRELQALLNQRQDIMPGELLSELKGLSLCPDSEDRTAKGNSLSSIMQSIRGNGVGETAEMTVEISAEDTGRRNSMYAWVGAAAAVLLIGIFYFFRKESRGGSSLAYDRIVTKTGSRTLINLPDSSTVVLNSACQFAYNKDFGVKKREMQLTGEAFFDIHGNPDMPLVVHAGNVMIRVLGTSFNVRAYAEDSFVEATLIKGVIEVSLKTDPERKILLRPNEKIVIRNEAGKTVSPADSGRSKSREEVIRVTQLAVDPRDSTYIETAWMKEKLVFRKEPFVSLAARMERFYQVKIVLADTSLRSLLFTGSFEKETVEEAFRALQRSASFSYSVDGKIITVTKRK